MLGRMSCEDAFAQGVERQARRTGLDSRGQCAVVAVGRKHPVRILKRLLKLDEEASPVLGAGRIAERMWPSFQKVFRTLIKWLWKKGQRLRRARGDERWSSTRARAPLFV